MEIVLLRKSEQNTLRLLFAKLKNVYVQTSLIFYVAER